MPRKHRIILILTAGTLALVLLLVVRSAQTEPMSNTYGWRNRMMDCYYAVKYSLPWNRGRSCIANLKHIDGAKSTWALDLKKTNSDMPTTNDLYGAMNYILSAPCCPSGGTYTLGRVDQKVRCSILGHTL